MKSLPAIAIILILPFFVIADEPPVNTLTPKEVADGWILLFDGKTTFGWTSPNDSKWTIADGMLAPQKDKEGLLVTTTSFHQFELNLQYNMRLESRFEPKPSSRPQILLACLPDGTQASSRGGRQLLEGRPILPGLKEPSTTGWIDMTLKVSDGGDKITIESDFKGESFKGSGTSTQKSKGSSGHLALSGNGIIFRNVKLRPTGLQPIFNNKDLDGWKEHPNRKSKFSVTKEGWLSVKDGPGDLQTTGEWANFVLQAECKTNGKDLNSGIFFRCLPGQYQMGYEAQIHNGFGPPKDYTLEIFDPKTSKLIEKKKEKFTATDYGTGAIYRRQPARFQAAQDNEWFTMTVIAQGRHLATWVNGMQTADWTDNRPLEENARKGAFLKKGPISIQGHDPTTDLLFRNFRIAELPAK